MAKPLKIMISSSVYGSLSLLRQIDVMLRTFKYEVLCSPVGSILVNPKDSNLENCLKAVKECDIFIGFIRPIYGSGRDNKLEKSITHLELEEAIKLGRPRWTLAHSSVVKMRSLLRKVYFNKDGTRNDLEFTPLKGEFDDLGVIEMYDIAADALNEEVPWSQRKNHWVHEYHYDYEALDFIKAQFKDTKLVQSLITSNSQ